MAKSLEDALKQARRRPEWLALKPSTVASGGKDLQSVSNRVDAIRDVANPAVRNRPNSRSRSPNERQPTDHDASASAKQPHRRRQKYLHASAERIRAKSRPTLQSWSSAPALRWWEGRHCGHGSSPAAMNGWREGAVGERTN